MIYRVRVKVYEDAPPVQVDLPGTLQEYAELWASIQGQLQSGQLETFRALIRLWTAADQYFLLRHVMSAGRDAWDRYRHEPHFQHPVHIELARRIQFDSNMNDTVLIGARALGKSSHFDSDDIRTVLVNPNHATYYFSLTKLLAQKHLSIIQQELDTNAMLKECWPDRFWRDTDERLSTDSGKVPWSEAAGLRIKRTTTRPEQTFEAHSFEYALPTGMHPDRRRYDDIEAERQVSSELTAETIEARWVSSQDLTSSLRGRRVTGTYYSPSAMMVKLHTEYGLTPAVYPGEDTKDPVPPEEAGPMGGRPVNGFTREHLWDRLKDKGGAEFVDGKWRRTTNQRAMIDYGRQTACDPQAGEATKLDWRWIAGVAGERFYDGDGLQYAKLGTVVLCADCSTGAYDPTWIWAWLLTPDKEFWWIDGERRVVDPLARRQLLHDVAQRLINYGAELVQLRLEQFGQATYVQDQETFWATMPSFPAPQVVKCNDNMRAEKVGRGEGKIWRNYERWQPHCAAGKVRFPRQMIRIDERGVPVDLVAYFKQFEFEMFPKSRTDNGLDAGALIWEKEERVGALPWPKDRYDSHMEAIRARMAHQHGQSYQSAGIA